MKQIIVHHHLGLGDHFICNGLVNYLSESADNLYLMCKEKNVKTVSCLYEDNKKVEVVPVKNETIDIDSFSRERDIRVLRVGFMDFDNKTFDKSFYSQLNLDFSLRYSNFKLPREIKNSKLLYDKLVTKEPYCLIHNTCSEGEIDIKVETELEKIYIKDGVTENLLDYIDVIRCAEEIHCIDSSIYHLIDSIEVRSKLYFHNDRNFFDNKIIASSKWIQI